MIKNLNKNKKKKKGFTLIELIIVIAIIAILAAIALPKFGDIKTSANIKADLSNAKNIHTTVITFIAEGTDTTNIGLINASLKDATAIDVAASTGAGKAIADKMQSVPTGKNITGSYKVWAQGGNIHVGLGSGTSITEVYPNGQSPYNN